MSCSIHETSPVLVPCGHVACFLVFSFFIEKKKKKIKKFMMEGPYLDVQLCLKFLWMF
jgi:hypothetical protein